MRRRPLQRPYAAHPNVTPLIDVVMCLIIFFMLVAKIGVSDGSDQKIEIPASRLGQDLAKLSGSSLVLNVREGVAEQPMVTALVESLLDPNAPKTGQPSELKLVDGQRRPLLEVLRKIRHGDPARQLKENADFKVIVRADQDAAYRFIEPVLKVCAEANVKNVVYQTRKPG